MDPLSAIMYAKTTGKPLLYYTQDGRRYKGTLSTVNEADSSITLTNGMWPR